MVRKVLFGALLIVGLFAGTAAAQYDPLVVTPGEVVEGGTVTVTGQGCQANEAVTITLFPGDATGQDTFPPASSKASTRAVPTGGIQVATTTTDENGNFTVTFTLPAGATPGEYTVQATCGSVVQSELITVVGATAAPIPGVPASPSGNLPRTGSNVDAMGLVGAGLLAAGGLVLLGTRKRRTSAATV
ncbi:hypothetical protein BH10ACT1_BH10ACT1_37350 [soil metagenome]